MEFTKSDILEVGMTVTLRNVDDSFLNVLKSILTLRKEIQIDTEYESPNELTEKVIRESEEDKNLSPVYSSTKEFMAALNA